MAQSELLIHTIEALTNSSNEYMLTGSFVSSMQGEPRATHDIDFVVAASAGSIESFLAHFDIDDFYYDVDVAKQAIGTGGMFNILSNTGDKVDIWALTDAEFDRSRFSRRQSVELFGIPVYVSTPEDTVLMKLLWAKEGGGSEKQFFDAAKVYEMQQEILDADYLSAWTLKLGLENQFVAMQRFL